MVTTSLVEFAGSIATIGARTDSAGAGVTDFTAEEGRLWASVWSEGILKPVDAFEPVAGAAATMNVIMGSGVSKKDVAVVESDNIGQESYVVRSDEATTTVTLSAADPGNPRIDEIYLLVNDDAYDSSARSLPRYGIREGDPSGAPVAPGPDSSWDAELLLASIAIPASAADILATTITDARVYANDQGMFGGWAPVGSILAFAAATAPPGWSLCDGAAISRATFKRLFQVIGTVYGVGDGSTTFNIPDTRQKFLLSKAASGTGASLADTGGSIDHVHTQGTHNHSMPSHVHQMNLHSHNMSFHTHSTNIAIFTSGASSASNTGSAGVNLVGGDTQSGSGTIRTGSHDHDHLHLMTHTHTIDPPSTVSGAPSNNTTTSDSAGQTQTTDPGDTNSTNAGATSATNPPFVVVNHIIKT